MPISFFLPAIFRFWRARKPACYWIGQRRKVVFEWLRVEKGKKEELHIFLERLRQKMPLEEKREEGKKEKAGLIFSFCNIFMPKKKVSAFRKQDEFTSLKKILSKKKQKLQTCTYILLFHVERGIS